MISLSKKKELLFVGGNARSGTTALAWLLNGHSRVFIGVERYFFLIKKMALQEKHFQKRRFLKVEPADTHDAHSSAQEPLHLRDSEGAEKFRQASVTGDKFPKVHLLFSWLWDRFPEAKILYIVRNPLSVAESYETRRKNEKDAWQQSFADAIKDWNTSVSSTLEAIRNDRNVIAVSYERLFSSQKAIDRLFETLGLDPAEQNHEVSQEVINGFWDRLESQGPRNEQIRFEIAQKADFQAYREIIEKHCAVRGLESSSRKEGLASGTQQLSEVSQ